MAHPDFSQTQHQKHLCVLTLDLQARNLQVPHLPPRPCRPRIRLQPNPHALRQLAAAVGSDTGSASRRVLRPITTMGAEITLDATWSITLSSCLITHSVRRGT